MALLPLVFFTYGEPIAERLTMERNQLVASVILFALFAEGEFVSNSASPFLDNGITKQNKFQHWLGELLVLALCFFLHLTKPTHGLWFSPLVW